MKNARGFSLLELVIAVAIVLILAAIVVPNLLRARAHANDAAAALDVRAISAAQTIYTTTYPHVGYADRLGKLGYPKGNAPVGPNAAGLLPDELACPSQPCSQNGYYFFISGATGSPVVRYSVIAAPIVPGKTGTRRYRTWNDDLLPSQAEESPIVKDTKSED